MICTGTGRYPDRAPEPYNARGRAMRILTCPVCGREVRKVGFRGPADLPRHNPEKESTR